MNLRKSQIAFIELLYSVYGKVDQITREDLTFLCEKNNINLPWWLINGKEFRLARGLYRVPSIQSTNIKPMVEISPKQKVSSTMISENETKLQIPTLYPGYVPFGNHDDLNMIVNSMKFWPIYITGLSGNGKTISVEQVCAMNKRQMVRVNITADTDEDDLIGGFRLVNGDTVWHDGPVVSAMENGAILLLDEVDLGSIKILCLQPVLEGKPIFIKKIGRTVTPKKGFNIIATANTKGKGSEDGRFVGTNVMNEAFLERYAVTFEQEYPIPEVEEKILNLQLKRDGMDNPEFVSMLVRWANTTRKGFYNGTSTELISTRRLVHICDAYTIWKGRRYKAVKVCVERFDPMNKKAFLELYTKIDAKAISEEEQFLAKSSGNVSAVKKPIVPIDGLSTEWQKVG